MNVLDDDKSGPQEIKAVQQKVDNALIQEAGLHQQQCKVGGDISDVS